MEWTMPTKDVPVCVVCAIEALEQEFWWYSYNLKNSLKEAEEVIDEVRQTTLKEGKKL